MKIQTNPLLPRDLPSLHRVLTSLFRDIIDQVNNQSENRLQATSNTATSAPTAGDYQVGDFVRNSSPAESGAVGSKYIITGWICTVASPLAFREARVLTGN